MDPASQSQTAEDFIASQLRLEADARDALPYQFDTCTNALGPLRQSVFACLTCTPPATSTNDSFTPAGVCYSCSISCHGEHRLVELFTKRDFVCDCGTTRLAGSPCRLRRSAQSGPDSGEGVVGEAARVGNAYNHNFAGKFCACEDEYDPDTEKGTMFQCLGLGALSDGGCGEDWWHPECLMGLPRGTHDERHEGEKEQAAFEDPPLPLGFPAEDDFDHLICYKCVEAFPWIKQYANTPGFLPAVPAERTVTAASTATTERPADTNTSSTAIPPPAETAEGRKRKAEADPDNVSQDSKKPRSEGETDDTSATTIQPATIPKHTTLPPTPTGRVSLFVTADFRDHFCRCDTCFPRLAAHPQLLDEEESYEPPLSESNEGAVHENGGSIAGHSVHSGSLLERGEAALSGIDRVRAIEGVMAYNHVRDKVKAFLQPFAESGQAVGAEDIKAYFAKLRGDEQAMRDAALGAADGGDVQDSGRKEQGGY